MNKNEIVEKIVECVNVSKKDCKLILDNFFEIIKDALNKGQAVSIKNFGKWQVKCLKEKKVYLPNQNKYKICNKKLVPKFYVSKKFKIEIL